MSKTSDNILCVRELQLHLRWSGHYKGALDDWGGLATRRAFREFAGAVAVPAPPIAVPDAAPGDLSDLPTPAVSYRLPAETTGALNEVYGPADRTGATMDWFSFPHEGTRLYTRQGTLLRDRTGDERLDHKCHPLLIGRLTAALAEIYVTLGREQFEREGWHVYGGCHNYRPKTGGSSLSIHAWGIGPDMNPGENPYQATKTTFSDTAIGIMEKWGFLSGGRAWNKDWMHFQAAIPNISRGSYYYKNGLPKNIVRA